MSKPIKLPFSIHEAVLLQAALCKYLSLDESLELALLYCNQDLHNGWLQSALVQISSDGKKTVTLLKPSDWQQWTERNRARYIGDQSDAAIRAAQINLPPTAEDPVVVPLASRRP